jgi:hypothetical protein
MPVIHAAGSRGTSDVRYGSWSDHDSTTFRKQLIQEHRDKGLAYRELIEAFRFAASGDVKSPNDKTVLKETIEDAKLPAEIEV